MGLLLKFGVLVLAWWAGRGDAQPTCNYDGHCDEGFYCENFTCRQCLKCRDFERETPSNPSSCIRSVTECGSCLKGFIVDASNDVGAACVLPQPSFGTTWIVVIIVVAVGLFILICVLILYILRKKGIFKMHAYFGASVESQSELPRPSAPTDLPPPYYPFETNQPAHNGVAESAAKPEDRVVNGAGALQPPPPPRSPSPSPYDALSTYTVNEEARQPFIKRSSPPPTHRPQAPAGRQQARVFNRPAYVYPSYPEQTVIVDADENTVNVHEEDTMESPWTPVQEPTEVTDSATGPALPPPEPPLSAQLETARGTVLVRAPRDTLPPPAKKKCLPHDSNNNGNQAGSGEPSMSGDSGSASASGVMTAIKVNVQATVQLNSVHQHDSTHRHPPYNGDPVQR